MLNRAEVVEDLISCRWIGVGDNDLVGGDDGADTGGGGLYHGGAVEAVDHGGLGVVEIGGAHDDPAGIDSGGGIEAKGDGDAATDGRGDSRNAGGVGVGNSGEGADGVFEAGRRVGRNSGSPE